MKLVGWLVGWSIHNLSFFIFIIKLNHIFTGTLFSSCSNRVVSSIENIFATTTTKKKNKKCRPHSMYTCAHHIVVVFILFSFHYHIMMLKISFVPEFIAVKWMTKLNPFCLFNKILMSITNTINFFPFSIYFFFLVSLSIFAFYFIPLLPSSSCSLSLCCFSKTLSFNNQWKQSK